MAQKKFDLNIEKILEDWESYHAVRELIANAMDENMLIGSQRDIDIYPTSNKTWHIRDFGRGVRYEHLTQNENEEKLNHDGVIGKFGIGLKDALATLYRKDIKVSIKSKHGDITLGRTYKQDFDDVMTLHAYIYPPSDGTFQGTEITLNGISSNEISAAKNLFHKFVGERVIDITPHGIVLEKEGSSGVIYVNGVKIAEEENFLFSYNITSLNATIKKALNRERTNVGRSAYTERVKSILLTSENKEVFRIIVDDLNKFSKGSTHDELKWLAVQDHAVKIMNANSDNTLFVTTDELMYAADMIDEARDNGYNVVTIPDNLKNKIQNSHDINGNAIRDLGQFTQERHENFHFTFINLTKLTAAERKVYNAGEKLIELLGGFPDNVKEIKISETMVKDAFSFHDAAGVWDPGKGRIIIKRDQLVSIREYTGTLLHELAHALSGEPDVNREFESVLTKLLGVVSEKALLVHSGR
ncbi:ATP-binding protein [Bacillus mycoides]|uniref:ATP-binding protein n=1 Tax=Bacillus mycoides TaxID=1405 RepID=UPI00273AD519|nr:ATP-binding protein [Bacillus mycoides]